MKDKPVQMSLKRHSNIFKKRLIELIKENKISEYKFAKFAGFCPTVIPHLKNGDHASPSFSTVIRSAIALKCSVDYLVGLSNDRGCFLD